MNKIRKILKTYFSNPKKISEIIGTIGLTMIFLGVILSPIVSFANLEPIRSVEISSTALSYETKEEGSWNITKSAEWISKGKARITLELESIVKQANDYTDFILVLDTSGSMNAETIDQEDNKVIKLDQLKSDVNELIDYMIPKGSNIALVTFNDTSTIVTNFTNDTTILKENITNLTATGETNYNQALKNVDTILKNYPKENNRDCVVLFLTDGLPTVETPNEIAQYEYLKKTYPYLVINGIQYEMGKEPLENIKNITDNEYVADVDTLKKYLYKAAISPTKYNKLEIKDYIETNYFNINDISFINSSTGEVSIDNNSIVWNLNGLNSGNKSKLIIDVNLNDELLNTGGIYPTSKNLEVNYQIGTISITERSQLTPILSDNYVVFYEENSPEGCTVSNMPSSTNKSVFDAVKIDSSTPPTCEGYKFKEWEILNKNISIVNEDYFVMPEEDVTLRAKWSKISVNKSMNGTVSIYAPLYKIIADNSLGLDTAIKTNGIHTLSSTQSDAYPVYYYRGNVENNNVLFADFCWKIVRTTTTGGVKLIYNGEPTEDGICLNNRSEHIGYDSITPISLPSSYYYGTSYNYDSTTGQFTLSGDLIEATWNEVTSKNLIGKFTCKNTTLDAECSKIYQIASYLDETQANALPLNTTTHYNQIGNSLFNPSIWSAADAGYMYDTRYERKIKDKIATTILIQHRTNSTSNYYYGNYIEYENGMYLLKNKILNDDGTYTVSEPEQKIWSDNYDTLSQHYTCRTTSSQCAEVYYIAGTTSSHQYNMLLTSGETDINKQKIILSKSKTKNDDGTYTLTEPIEVLKKDWFNDYNNYINYYTCNDLSSTTCSPMSQVLATDLSNIRYLETIGYVYGNDISWDGENYTLIDTIESEEGWSTDRSNIFTKYHYTCLSTNNVCENGEVYYAYYFSSNDTISYLTFSNGIDLEQAKTEMFTNDENSMSSYAKLQIDSWYQTNMLEYTDKLEDTIWCNDRTFQSGPLKSKDSSDSSYSTFGIYERRKNPSLICQEQTRDGFTVSTESGGNGLLTYPVGLLTGDELFLSGLGLHGKDETHYLYAPIDSWTMSPYMITTGVVGTINSKLGGVNYKENFYSSHIRPSVSLKPGTKSIDGDGTAEDPFIVE